ncbi:LAGLIDADG family homing endonuclease [Nanoarchaeota archaeon]
MVLTKKVVPDIAEILGAFIGDGWIEKDLDGFYITGSPTEDRQYYDNHLSKLFSKYFTHVQPKEFTSWGVYGIYTYRREVIKKAINLGFQIGHKSLSVKIPEYLLNNTPEVTTSLIRGIFDTDGSFFCDHSRAPTSIEWKKTHNYSPEIQITSCSKELMGQLFDLTSNIGLRPKLHHKSRKGFVCGRNVNNSYALRIRRLSDVIKWFDTIGSKNPRHITRYSLWKKLGFLPPNTNLQQRVNILGME